MPKRTHSIISTDPEVLKSLELLGLRIRANRVAAGWTVKDMAGRLLCSQNTYRAIEAGKPTASIVSSPTHSGYSDNWILLTQLPLCQ